MSIGIEGVGEQPIDGTSQLEHHLRGALAHLAVAEALGQIDHIDDTSDVTTIMGDIAVHIGTLTRLHVQVQPVPALVPEAPKPAEQNRYHQLLGDIFGTEAISELPEEILARLLNNTLDYYATLPIRRATPESKAARQYQILQYASGKSLEEIAKEFSTTKSVLKGGMDRAVQGIVRTAEQSELKRLLEATQEPLEDAPAKVAVKAFGFKPPKFDDMASAIDYENDMGDENEEDEEESVEIVLNKEQISIADSDYQIYNDEHQLLKILVDQDHALTGRELAEILIGPEVSIRDIEQIEQELFIMNKRGILQQTVREVTDFPLLEYTINTDPEADLAKKTRSLYRRRGCLFGRFRSNGAACAIRSIGNDLARRFVENTFARPSYGRRCI